MKPGRPPKSGGEYANSRAVETAILKLREKGAVWVTSREVIDELERGAVPNARVVWSRGKTRLIEDHERLDVRAELDPKNRPVAKYSLRFVEGVSFKIPMEEYSRLPPDLRRFYRPTEPRPAMQAGKTGMEALGGLFEALSAANLETLSTERLEREILRRERANPKELLTPFSVQIGEAARELQKLRPLRGELLKQIIRERERARRSQRARPASSASPGGREESPSTH